jgi:hypothetical protein
MRGSVEIDCRARAMIASGSHVATVKINASEIIQNGGRGRRGFGNSTGA